MWEDVTGARAELEPTSVQGSMHVLSVLALSCKFDLGVYDQFAGWFGTTCLHQALDMEHVAELMAWLSTLQGMEVQIQMYSYRLQVILCM